MSSNRPGGTCIGRVEFRDFRPSRRRKLDPRQVDGEDASATGQVARMDPATVRFDARSAEAEAKPQASSIGASLLERAEQFVEVFIRKTAAFVLDLNQHALGAGADAERDRRQRE